MILVDTTIWSLALRRRRERLSDVERVLVDHWAVVAGRGLVAVTGTIRQEVLSGVRHAEQFAKLAAALDAFQYLPVDAADFDLAAEFFNTCQRHGIAAGDADMLICAASTRHGCPVFTTDADFTRYATCLPVRTYQPPP